MAAAVDTESLLALIATLKDAVIKIEAEKAVLEDKVAVLEAEKAVLEDKVIKIEAENAVLERRLWGALLGASVSSWRHWSLSRNGIVASVYCSLVRAPDLVA